MAFFGGSPAKYEQVSTLLPYQQGPHKQLNAAVSQGIPQLSNYYSNLLSDNPLDFQAMAAPEMRRFNEQIVPRLAEQFAGMGSGGLSSSGFRNAAVSAGTDLSERLGALRAQLRQSGAAGLQGLISPAFQNVSQSVMTEPGSEGFLSSVAPIVGGALGAFGGPMLGALGTTAGNWLSNKFGKSSPYGNTGSLPAPTPFKAPDFQYSMKR